MQQAMSGSGLRHLSYRYPFEIGASQAQKASPLCTRGRSIWPPHLGNEDARQTEHVAREHVPVLPTLAPILVGVMTMQVEVGLIGPAS